MNGNVEGRVLVEAITPFLPWIAGLLALIIVVGLFDRHLNQQLIDNQRTLIDAQRRNIALCELQIQRYKTKLNGH